MTAEGLIERVPALAAGTTVFSPELVRGQAVVIVERADAVRVLTMLRDHPELAFDMLMDLTAVDYLGRTPRFEVVYQLYSLAHSHRLRVKVPVPEDDPTVPSVASLWKSATWAERETFDMFGVRFSGHPDLRRILMYPEFEGYPLRKDYPLMRRQPLVPERDPIVRPWPRRTEA